MERIDTERKEFIVLIDSSSFCLFRMQKQLKAVKAVKLKTMTIHKALYPIPTNPMLLLLLLPKTQVAMKHWWK